MDVLKKIALKGLLLIGVLVSLNFVYKATLFNQDLEEYSDFIFKINETKNADIVYLGDCSDSFFGKGHETEKGISQLLDSLLPTQKVATISEVGFHAGVYNALLQQIPQNSKVKTVIVTLNLRSFASRIIHSFYNNSFNQRLVMLDAKYPPLLNRYFLSFKKATIYNQNELNKMYNEEAKKNNLQLPNSNYQNLYDWKTAFENGNYISFDETWTTLKKDKGVSHIVNYGFQIDVQQNPRIKEFDQIVATCKKRNWKLIFHLLPEDIETAKNLMGKEIPYLINYNRNLLHQRYQNSVVVILDNMDLLTEKDFIADLPNSHFYYNGRKLMAKEIVKFLENDKVSQNR